MVLQFWHGKLGIVVTVPRIQPHAAPELHRRLQMDGNQRMRKEEQENTLPCRMKPRPRVSRDIAVEHGLILLHHGKSVNSHGPDSQNTCLRRPVGPCAESERGPRFATPSPVGPRLTRVRVTIRGLRAHEWSRRLGEDSISQ